MKLLIDFDTNAENQIQAKKQHTAPAMSKLFPELKRLLESDHSLDCLIVPLLDTDWFSCGKAPESVPISWLAGMATRLLTGTGRATELSASPGTWDKHRTVRCEKETALRDAFAQHGAVLNNLLNVAKPFSAGNVSELNVPAGQLQRSLSQLAGALQLREGDLPTLLVCIGTREQFSKDITSRIGLRSKHLLVRTVDNRIVLYSAGEADQVSKEVKELKEILGLGDELELVTRSY
ncbi:hypothetical protein HG444_001070 [Candidatus Saccharibacteria bacterium]|nr:hypothetical protein [Candidatus Saccharibacteria bacterium]